MIIKKGETYKSLIITSHKIEVEYATNIIVGTIEEAICKARVQVNR